MIYGLRRDFWEVKTEKSSRREKIPLNWILPRNFPRDAFSAQVVRASIVDTEISSTETRSNFFLSHSQFVCDRLDCTRERCQWRRIPDDSYQRSMESERDQSHFVAYRVAFCSCYFAFIQIRAYFPEFQASLSQQFLKRVSLASI